MVHSAQARAAASTACSWTAAAPFRRDCWWAPTGPTPGEQVLRLAERGAAFWQGIMSIAGEVVSLV